MALTSKSDGLGAPNLFTAAWVNDFMNLLTGVMTDQAATLNYRPGSGTTPTLLLKGDGFGPLIRGLKSDNSTQAFRIDSSGNLTLAGSITMVGALSGVTTLAASGAVTLSSTLAVTGAITRNGNTVWDAGNHGSGSGLDADMVDGKHANAFALLAGATFTGTLNVSSGSLQIGGKNVIFAQEGLSGKFSAKTTAPTSPADGDLWLDLSVVLS